MLLNWQGNAANMCVHAQTGREAFSNSDTEKSILTYSALGDADARLPGGNAVDGNHLP